MSPIKAAIPWPNGKGYLFDGANNQYLRYDFHSGTQDQAPQPIAPMWPGLRPNVPDAAVYWGFGKVYFFYGDEYVRFDIGNNAVDPGYSPPLKIAGNWPGWPGHWTDFIDAAVNWGNGKIYFFRKSEYLRYDISQDRVDPGYPIPINPNWPGVWPDNLDAVLYQGGEKAYFFKGSEYRRFDLTTNNVDQSGHISTLTLDRVPPGIWTPSRDLTLDQANLIIGYLIQNGKFSLSSTQTPYAGNWMNTIVSPQPASKVVVKPANIDGVDFIHEAGPAPVIDNLDQRMLICLYRLTRWVNSSEPNVTVIRHMGIGHGSGPPTDCHNQGRALDLSGLEGSSMGVPFIRKVLHDWGTKPVILENPMRLNQLADPLAHDLFRTVFLFATFECECNGIGPGNKWPPKEISDVGGFVIHPDYIDHPPPAQQLRFNHQDHIHMQIGPTRI
ncbi:hemopexin repeat-containing protein [Peribacillus sp. NJ11]|uniref:hemopexin repeat-containing protein n=1 Tax=Peribacillus sp. NJ11 TaxID=3055861 RepID=UPI0025A30B47|nr:hemopexin repeat-containing protein [Peribacillus sp. NJ11]MDM5223545.1 hemopexin repeat-containing protein [Peribacillus sp. NJ11]